MKQVDYEGLAWTKGDTEFAFYIYEDEDPSDPRFSFWMYSDDAGMSLFERPPDGQGKWLCPERKSDSDSVPPSEEFKQIMAMLMGDGVDAGGVRQLPPHEEYLFRCIHGTAEENPEAIPGPIWAFMSECEREYRIADSSQNGNRSGGEN